MDDPRSSAESRALGYLRTAERDPDNINANITLQGPGGFRVIVPPALPPNPNDNATPPPGTCPAVGGVFTPSSPSPPGCTGEYTPILRGHIVFGPQPCRFLCAILLFMAILTLLALQAPDMAQEFGEYGNPLTSLGFILHCLALVSFLFIGASDPGVIPGNYRLRELIRDTEGYRRRNPDSRFYRYCDICRGFRPPKSKHCEDCNICIRDHETHLIVGGTCVGQRTARSLIVLSITSGLLTLYLIIINSIIIHNALPYTDPWRIGVAIVSLILGLILMLTPQLGVILFLFRLFLIGMGYTGSSFIHRHNQWMTCPVDERSTTKNYVAFFFGKRSPSIFRKKLRQVEPEVGPASGGEHADEDWISLVSNPVHLLPLINELFRVQDEAESADLTEQNRRRRANFLHNRDLNNNTDSRLLQEHLLMSQVADAARPKTIPSDPQLYSGELDAIPSQRLRKGLKSGLCSTLTQKMQDAQRGRSKSPRISGVGDPRSRSRSVSRSKSSTSVTLPLEQATLSEGSIPHSDETGLVVNTARATQFRRLVQLILTRDREGLREMGRTVNIPALLGVQHFDPDNFQFVESSNGLPSIAMRRVPQGQPLPRNSFGIAGIVAAGLLPPARELAHDMERAIGRGSIRRSLHPGTDIHVFETTRDHRSPRNIHRPFNLPPRLDFAVPDTNSSLLSMFGAGFRRQFGHDAHDRRRRSCPAPSLVGTGWRRSAQIGSRDTSQPERHLPIQGQIISPDPPAQSASLSDEENNNENATDSQ